MRIPHPSLLVAGMLACNMALAQSERSVQFSFSGTTAASESLIQDVMKNVMAIGDEEFNCPAPEAVTADVLAKDFRQAAPDPVPEGAGQPVYERWMISFCGNEIPFLLTFWTLEQGGTAFDLDYPFHETVSAADGSETPLH